MIVIDWTISYSTCRDAVCSRDILLPSYSGLFETAKETDIDNMGQIDNTRQESSLNEPSTTDCLKLQLSEQYPFHAYSNLNLPTTGKLDVGTEENIQAVSIITSIAVINFLDQSATICIKIGSLNLVPTLFPCLLRVHTQR